MPPSQKNSLSRNPLNLPRLYAIVDADVCARFDRAPVDVARAFLGGGAKWIQLRCKNLPSGAFLELANGVVADARAADAVVIINDRADIARMSGAHGVHVGQDDLSPVDARSVVGEDAIVGLSTHTVDQWTAAVDQPISYMAIGPAFGTTTKNTGYREVGLEIVRAAASVAAARHVPTVAIGGITIHNARSVLDAGAASVAVITDLMHGDPESRCRELLATLR